MYVNSVVINKCTTGVFLTFRPYGLPYFNAFVMGIDILMIAGSGLLINCNWLTYNLWASLIQVGGIAAVVGKD